jgi:hypothetical protein
MSSRTQSRIWISGLLATLSIALGAAPASGAAGDPTYFVNTGDRPCGLSVDPSGRILVSKYYENAIRNYSSAGVLQALAATEVDPVGGPCATAVDVSGNLYVNGFHTSVRKLNLNGKGDGYTFGGEFPVDEPTGIAYEPISNRVFVNERDQVGAYSPLGVPQLTFGSGLVEDGYGLAVSSYTLTAGAVYVADDANKRIRVFNSNGVLLSTFGAPVGTFKGFTSLRDTAIAVAKISGDIYVSDYVGPDYSEKPEAIIHVFDYQGTYKGRLKYAVIENRPVGLAVDNTAGTAKGTVYVTSGPAVYGYPQGSALASGLPAQNSLSVSAVGSGRGSIVGDDAGIACSATCSATLLGGEKAELHAVPAPGSTFTGWSGDCSGQGSCVVTMSGAQSVRAEFAPAPAAGVPAGASPIQSATSSSVRAQARERPRKKRRRNAKLRHGVEHRHGQNHRR